MRWRASAWAACAGAGALACSGAARAETAANAEHAAVVARPAAQPDIVTVHFARLPSISVKTAHVAISPGPVFGYRPAEGYFEGTVGLAAWPSVPITPPGALSIVRTGKSTVAVVSKPFSGLWQPYLGLGLSYRAHRRSLALSGNRIKGSNGPLVQAGLEFRMAPGAGLFLDAKKGFFKRQFVDEAGSMRPPTVMRSGPLVLMAGAAWRF